MYRKPKHISDDKGDNRNYKTSVSFANISSTKHYLGNDFQQPSGGERTEREISGERERQTDRQTDRQTERRL